MVVRLQPTTPAELSFHADTGAASRLSTAQAVQFTQIARTALSNCLRHARPQHISIALRSSEGSVSLEIVDDGAGFDPERPNGEGIGLQTMRRRASEAGGTLVISSRPGEGTRIVVTIPVKHVEALKG
jgi:signal transduction histidine kinase